MLNNRIRLRKYKNEDFDNLNYVLNEEQSKFTASIIYCVNERQDNKNPLRDIVSIIYNDIVVGFFVLDRSKDKLNLTNNKDAILLRSFSINPKYQGKGIGISSMILVSDFIKQNIANINEIILSVNCKNKKAYQTYIKAGFVDTKKIILGRAGEQNVLSKTI